MRVPPLENPMCAAFEEDKEVPETVPLYFIEYDMMWVTSKLSGTAGALGAEAIELKNWLLRFRCETEELRVVVARLADFMAYAFPPWAAHCASMACRLVALDKRSGVRPVGIGETLRRALAKLVMRAAGDQAKTSCGNLHLCAGLEAGIEGATHAVGQSRLERAIRRQQEGEEAGDSVEEEESRGVSGLLNNITIEAAGTEEEAVEHLEAALWIQVEDTGEIEVEEVSEGDAM